jgi:hypothetical protein
MGGVRRGEALADRDHDADRDGPRQPPFVDERLAQRASLEELERHDELPVDLAGRQAAHDVGVLELREDLHLVEEEPPPLLALGQLGPQDLEGDAALGEPLLGLVDLAHPTFADHAADLVLANALHGRSPRALVRG